MADLSILDRTVAAIKKAIVGLPKEELAALAEAEESGKTRKTVLALLGDQNVDLEILADGVFTAADMRADAGDVVMDVHPEIARLLIERGQAKAL